MKKIILMCFMISSSSLAFADCASISTAIETHLKESAYQDASGFLDNSAPRETMRQAAITAHSTQVGVLLNQLNILKCPISKEPYDSSKYTSAATSCSLARGDEIKEKCNKSEWKPFVASKN